MRASHESCRLRLALPSRSRVVTLVAAALCLSGAATATAASHAAAAAVTAAPSPTVSLDGSPGVPAATPATHSLYVPVQCTDSSCATPSHVVDVVNTDACNTQVASACTVVARAKAGESPLDAVVDPATDTVYAINGGGTITVINGVTCNAVVAVGCPTPIATINLGQFAVAGAIDTQTHTLYVASPAGYVFVVDISACTVQDHDGCGAPVTRIADKGDPDAIDVDAATDTVYAANDGASGSGHTLSVIDGAACNGNTAAGCGRVHHARVGSGPYWLTVDQATDTVYTANFNDGTVSVLDGGTCDSAVHTGCDRVAPSVTAGAQTAFVGLDSAVHTLLALNTGDDTMSALDADTCTGVTPDGCPVRAPASKALPDQGPDYEGFPSAFASVAKTNSLYVLSVGGASIMTVVGTHDCDAETTSGCRGVAPSVSVTDDSMALDASSHTLYLSDYAQPTVDVFDADSCDTGDLSSCAVIATIPVAATDEQLGALDRSTHTLYASDSSGGSLQVIDLSRCTAADTSGCTDGAVASTAVGPFPGATALNPLTHTLYALYGLPSLPRPGHVAVIDAATCNAEDTSGCAAAPGVVTLTAAGLHLAVSKATDTVYVTEPGPGFSGSSLAVIDGGSCNALVSSGCGNGSATATVGSGPDGVVVSEMTHTVYVSDNGDGDIPGTVTVIDASTCTAADAAGCAPVASAPVGRSPRGLAIEPSGRHLYVADGSSAAVSEVDAAACSAVTQVGCATPAPEQPVASLPSQVAVDPGAHTVYVLGRYTTGALSVVPTARS